MKVSISLPGPLLEKVDQARGPIPRSRWLQEAAQAWLEEDHIVRQAIEELTKRVATLELARGKAAQEVS
ncbi:MAG: hypothetical protein V3W28_07740 [Thermoplasmata archaeon]